MTLTSQVRAAACVVQCLSLALAAALLVGFVAVQAFASRYGEPGAVVVLDATSTGDPLLTSAIDEQESAGLRCSERPTLTDVILFQREHSAEVRVLTFAQAVEASAARAGWIRRYCV